MTRLLVTGESLIFHHLTPLGRPIYTGGTSSGDCLALVSADRVNQHVTLISCQEQRRGSTSRLTWHVSWYVLVARASTGVNTGAQGEVKRGYFES